MPKKEKPDSKEKDPPPATIYNTIQASSNPSSEDGAAKKHFWGRWLAGTAPEWLATVGAVGALIFAYQAIQISKNETRAYVTVIEPEITIENSVYIAKYKVKNTGNSTAYDVSDSSRFEILPNADVGRLPNPACWESRILDRVVGGGEYIPGYNYTSGVYSPTANRIVLYGIVRYTDIYGVWHWTTYHYHFTHLYGATTIQEAYNSADRDGEGYKPCDGE